MAKAFSMPSADSRIGISQIGRLTDCRLAIDFDSSHNVRYLLRRLHLRNQDQVGRLRNDLL